MILSAIFFDPGYWSSLADISLRHLSTASWDMFVDRSLKKWAQLTRAPYPLPHPAKLGPATHTQRHENDLVDHSCVVQCYFPMSFLKVCAYDHSNACFLGWCPGFVIRVSHHLCYFLSVWILALLFGNICIEQLPTQFTAKVNITAHHVDRTRDYPPWLKVRLRVNVQVCVVNGAKTLAQHLLAHSQKKYNVIPKHFTQFALIFLLTIACWVYRLECLITRVVNKNKHQHSGNVHALDYVSAPEISGSHSDWCLLNDCVGPYRLSCLKMWLSDLNIIGAARINFQCLLCISVPEGSVGTASGSNPRLHGFDLLLWEMICD